MTRYHEAHGHLPSRGRTAGRQRNFDEQDVHWLRNLQTLLAAGVPTPTAMRALRGELSGLEQEAIYRAFDRVTRSGTYLSTARSPRMRLRRSAPTPEDRSRRSLPCRRASLRGPETIHPAVPAQVVCRRLWMLVQQAQGDDFSAIGLQDVKNHVYISTALADYSAAAVDDVACDTGVDEMAIRRWFEQQLIARGDSARRP
jgi:DNA-binding transcriptional MerR regulator